MKKIHLLLIAFLVSFFGYSQNKQSHSLGNLTKFSRNDQTFTLKTTSGLATVTVFSPDIFRIRIVQNGFLDDFSYSVVGKPQPCHLTVKEESRMITISTDSLVLEMTKKPLRFTFKTLDGKTINEDDASFGTNWVGDEITTYKKLQEDERFIGLGEKTGSLDRRGNTYVNWNTDNPHHQNWDDPLYATFPFYIGIHHGLNYGIFFDNSYRSTFNFGASNDRFSSFGALGGEMDYYFIWHTRVADILSSYSFLTGKMEMPPLWSLGFQQCRWSYFPDKEVLNIAHSFREKKIPLDVLYLDIHYMDNYKIFTWNPTRFSEPKKMLNELKSLGIHTTVIVDPGIKVEKGYTAYEEGVAKDMFVKYPDNTNYTAQVWPGWCHFPDFTNPKVRTWWGDNFETLSDAGVEGFWNDMNEPASWGGGTSPNLIGFDWEGKKTLFPQAKNVYGLLMSRATFEGTKKLLNGKRPLILTRAGFAGLQRYSAIWTGDNTPSDDHMMLGVRMVNSIGLAGVPFCGYDVGGFMGDASAALFTRWLTVGSFTPFFRSHKAYNNKESEPWSYGEDMEVISRDYITLRYKLMPYIYSAFYNATRTGLPVARTLAIDYTYQPAVYDNNYQNQYLFGPSLLVIPAVSTASLTKAWLPAGEWYDFYSDKTYNGNQELNIDCPLQRLPVFVKAGSIIPMQSAIQSTSEKPSDTLTIHLYAGKNVNAFDYYEDDGTTYAYQNQQYDKRVFRYQPAKNQLLISKKEGTFNSRYRYICLVFHGFTDNNNPVKVNGSPAPRETVSIRMLQSLSEKDALSVWVPWQYDVISLPSVTFGNSDGEMRVEW
jgi:alpha-glucosidase